ncbi:hypothetical protein VN97_g4088 [Penicillium thymicola]|uniref:Uncharacterized protein n=1 Tax=Penicillium thymicola TaxID=293382 RepID=A0AAI9X9N9_PENTH|nr:hypothetical protein VN97_g4088 [Penicillium thymicola]
MRLVVPTIVSYLSLVHYSLQFVASRSAGVCAVGVVGAELQSVFAVKESPVVLFRRRAIVKASLGVFVGWY